MGHYYCGRPDIRQALGPGWIGLRTDRQYADHPVRAGFVSSWRGCANRVVSTVITAASSSSVGEPLTMGEQRILIIWDGHSGMLPCFLGGKVWRLVRSSRSTRAISLVSRVG